MPRNLVTTTTTTTTTTAAAATTTTTTTAAAAATSMMLMLMMMLIRTHSLLVSISISQSIIVALYCRDVMKQTVRTLPGRVASPLKIRIVALLLR
jgi:hypothetical protein